jgi:hypothetical protein
LARTEMPVGLGTSTVSFQSTLPLFLLLLHCFLTCSVCGPIFFHHIFIIIHISPLVLYKELYVLSYSCTSPDTLSVP